MKRSTKNRAKGVFHEVRGSVKEFAAKISSSRMLGVKGRFERVAGKVQGRIGKTQGFFGL